MPTVQVWIKNEDWDKYYQLSSSKRWGEFIHNALNRRGQLYEVGGKLMTDKPIKTPKGHSVSEAMKNPDKINIKSPKDAMKQIEKINPKFEYKLCKIHGTPLDSRGKCLQKNCKYA